MSWLDKEFNSGVPGPAGPAGAGAGVFSLSSVATSYGIKVSETRTVGCRYAVNVLGLIISGAQFWWPASAAGTTVIVDLWDAAGNNLANVAVVPVAGINTVFFGTPFTVTQSYLETELTLSIWNVSHSEVPAINPPTWPSVITPTLPVFRDARGTRLTRITFYNNSSHGWPNTDNGGAEYYAIDPMFGN
jgi:hypothetical protein